MTASQEGRCSIELLKSVVPKLLSTLSVIVHYMSDNEVTGIFWWHQEES
jgi:hypothetical protein